MSHPWDGLPPRRGPEAEPEAPRRDMAAMWLSGALADGPVATNTLHVEAEGRGSPGRRDAALPSISASPSRKRDMRPDGHGACPTIMISGARRSSFDRPARHSTAAVSVGGQD
jgi:hypothetical protein